jgi:serine protease AprX
VSQGAVRAAVAELGGRVVAFQPRVRTVVVTLPDGAVSRAASAVPGVVGVAADGELTPQSLGFSPSSQPGSMTNVTEFTGAQAMWARGYTGAGVDVALIDTGVAPVSGMNASDKVFVGPDLSFESQSDSARYLDTFGHGTNMGGIIAGREVARSNGTNYAADDSNFYGMAPDSRLVDIKVGDRSGAADVTQMIAAIDWVIANRYSNGLNIRIINLSYGNQSSLDQASDPVSWAAESAWKAGIVVVASSGNDGANVGLASPGFNNWIITVGAADTKGTQSYTDDSIPSFSQVGTGVTRGPDVLAPGVGIVSLGVNGSQLRNSYPSAAIGNGFMRGSGTSQAAAVVSGAVALILQKHPGMWPNDVKAYLKKISVTLNGYSTAQQGRGEINLRTAINLEPTYYSTQPLANGNGTGSINAARGGNYVTVGGVQISGEVDIMGNAWNSAEMANRVANGNAWVNGNFNFASWLGSGYVADYTSWAGKTWQGKTWQATTWLGKTWQGKTWQSGTWNGSAWNSASWGTPVNAPWAGRTWSSANWG